MTRPLLAACLLLCTQSTAWAGIKKPDTMAWAWPSGLKVLYKQDTRHPIVHASVGLDVGTSATARDARQVAELVPLLWTQSEMDGTNIYNVLDARACTLDASAAHDISVYVSACPAVMAPLQLQVIASVLDEARFDVGERIFEDTRHDLGLILDHGEGTTPRILMQARQHLYSDDHPHRYPVASLSSAFADKVTPTDVQAWVAQYHQPEHALLTLAGDLEPLQAIALLHDQLPPHLLHPALTPEHTRTFTGEQLAFFGVDADDEVVWYEDPDQPGEPLAVVSWDLQQDAPSPSVSRTPQARKIVKDAPVDDHLIEVDWLLPGVTETNYWALTRVARFAEAELNSVLEDTKGVGRVNCSDGLGRHGTVLRCVASAETRRKAELALTDMARAFGRSSYDDDGETRLADAAKESGAFRFHGRVPTGASDVGTNLVYSLMTGGPDLKTSRRAHQQPEVIEGMRGLLSKHMTVSKALTVHLRPADEQPSRGSSGATLWTTDLDYAPELPSVEGQMAREIYGRVQVKKAHGRLTVATLPIPGDLYSRFSLGLRRFDDGMQMALDDRLYFGHFGPNPSIVHKYTWGRTSTYSLPTTDAARYTGVDYTIRTTPGDLEAIVRYMMPYVAKIPGDDISDDGVEVWGEYLQNLWGRESHWVANWRVQALTGEPRSGGYDHALSMAAANLPPAELKAYFRERLSPSNAAFVISGKIDARRAANMVDQWSEEWSKKHKWDPSPDKALVPADARWGTGRHLALVPSDDTSGEVELSMTCPVSGDAGASAADDLALDHLSWRLIAAAVDHTGARDLDLSWSKLSRTYLHGNAVELRTKITPDQAGEVFDLLNTLGDDLAAHLDEDALERARRRYFLEQQAHHTMPHVFHTTVIRDLMAGRDPRDRVLKAADLDRVDTAHIQQMWSTCPGNEVYVARGLEEDLREVESAWPDEADWIHWRKTRDEQLALLTPGTD